MSIGKIKILRTGLIVLLAVALIFTMTFNSKVIALDELQMEQVKAVEKLINGLPSVETLTIENQNDVAQARKAYNNLGEELQAEVSDEHYSKLEKLEKQLAILKAVDKVVKKIDLIPAKISLKDKSLVNSAKKAYYDLKRTNRLANKYFLSHFKKKYDKLYHARMRIKELTRIKASKVEAAKVTKKIRKIPKNSKIKYKHKKRVNRAYKAYKKLKKSSRKYVPKKQRTKLFKAVKKIKRYEKKIKAFKKAKTSVKLYTSERLNIKVAWKKVKRAKKYIVYRKTTDDKYHKVKVTKERSLIDKNRYKTTRNVYKVKAVTEIGGKKVYSKYSKAKNKSLLAKSTIVKATAYSGGGHCANGMPVGVGRIATDPRYIPLGTWLYVEGYGLSQACDTGGAIKGWFIDVYFTSNSTCNRWGVKYPRVWILK